MRVYIAGALSSKEDTDRSPSRVVIDYIQNIHKMCCAASYVRAAGMYPFVPGLDFLLGVVIGDWEEWDYRDIGIAFMEVCDVILVISNSWGVQEELKIADKLGIPVVHNMKELQDGIKDGTIIEGVLRTSFVSRNYARGVRTTLPKE